MSHNDQTPPGAVLRGSMRQYLDMIDHVLREGSEHEDRTGTGTLRMFGHHARSDLSAGFPLVTTKKASFRNIALELLWFMHGRTDETWLAERKVKIWAEWATEEYLEKWGREAGDLGPIYGFQWRHFGARYTDRDADYEGKGVDQLAWVVNEIQTNPNSRRMLVSAWNPVDLPEMALPPCHTLFQFQVQDGKLNCHLFQRSADLFLGVPYNIASYSLMTYMIAHVTGLEPGTFVHSLSDLHIYTDHLEQVRQQLDRDPYPLPTLKIDPALANTGFEGLMKMDYSHLTLENYQHHPRIRARISV